MVLESIGRYTLAIHCAYIFSDSCMHETIYEKTEEEYFYIISFQAFAVYRFSLFENEALTIGSNKTYNIIYQPDWGVYPINKFHTFLIWEKLIKSSVTKAQLIW